MAGETEPHPPPTGDFGISVGQISAITRDHDHNALEALGGVSLPLSLFSVLFYYSYLRFIFLFYIYQVKGVADALKTDIEKGIHEDDADLLKRKNAFGSNTYPQKKGRSFWVTSFADLYLVSLLTFPSIFPLLSLLL